MADRSRGLILISIGNPLRGDDGIAHRVLQQLGQDLACETRSVLQLTPELAAEIADYSTVIFLDADASATDLSIDPVLPPASPPSLSHIATPGEIVALSSALFGFRGRAFVCRIPAADFSPGETLGISSETLSSEDLVERAAHALGAIARETRLS